MRRNWRGRDGGRAVRSNEGRDVGAKKGLRVRFGM